MRDFPLWDATLYKYKPQSYHLTNLNCPLTNHESVLFSGHPISVLCSQHLDSGMMEEGRNRAITETRMQQMSQTGEQMHTGHTAVN